MKKLILSVALFALVTTGLLCGQMGPANIAGTLYASNFAGWTVAQGNNGPFSWSSSSVCTAATSGGVTFQPFHVGTPIAILDGTSPTLNEIVTPTAVNINGSGCSITVSPVHQHFSFYLATATSGLQEAINYANGRSYLIYVTPDFSRSGGTTAMITGASGNSAVTILDQRSSVIVPYLWNGTAYASQPFSGGGTPAPPQFAVQFASAGATQFNADSTFTFTPSTHALSSLVDNEVSQAQAIDVASMNSLLTSIGTTGSVVIPKTVPALTAPPVYNNPSTVITTGGHLGPGTYSYLICSVSSAGVEQKCSSSVLGSSSSNHSSIIISSGTTNIIQFAFGAVTGITHYNLYGRVAGSWGFIKTLITGGGALTDDGSITPGAAPQQNFSNTNAVGIDDLRYGVIQHYATGVPVREFGCMEDGVTDDTACIQAAINYAESSGIDIVDFTPGKTYKVASVSGSIALAGDDGTCPSGATVNGAACTAIAAQYTMQAYSINLGEGNLKLRLNGATIEGGYTPTQGASPSAPSLFACSGGSGCSQLEIDGGASGTNGITGAIQSVFIGLVAPGDYAFNSIHDVNFGNCGFPILVQQWDSSEAHNNTVSCEAGFTIGGWYYNRANNGSPGLNSELGGYADGYQISNSRYNGLGAFLANHANTDNYFYTYIYQGQNQGNGRMVDVPGTSSPNGALSWNTQIPYFGVFGFANILYGRYGRQDNGPYISNFQMKNMARSAVIASAEVSGGTFLTLGAEFTALCDNPAFFVGDPVNCPDPYTTGINVGFMHGLFFHAFANGISNPAGYQASFSNGFQSTYLNTGSTPTQADSNPPNQLALVGTNNESATHSSVSGTIHFIDNTQGTPGNPSTSTPDTWGISVLQNVGDGAPGAGTFMDLAHLTSGVIVSNLWVRVPSLMLANNPQGLCDGPGTLYTGHEGMMTFTYGASGVADTAAVCMKNAAGAFAWQPIAVTNGFTGSCAATTTLAVVNGRITGCS